MFRQSTVALVVACCLSSVAASAQLDGERRGFWLSVGAGGGWNEGLRGASGYLRMGGTPHDRAQFGVQILRWWRVEDHEAFGRTNVGVAAQLFPVGASTHDRSPLGDWCVRAGFGIANVDHFMRGVALNLGTGIDLGMDGRFFLTPSVDVLIQFYQNFTETALLFTVGLTWH